VLQVFCVSFLVGLCAFNLTFNERELTLIIIIFQLPWRDMFTIALKLYPALTKCKPVICIFSNELIYPWVQVYILFAL